MSILFRVVLVSAIGAFVGYLTAGGDPRALGISDAYASQGEAFAKQAHTQFLDIKDQIKLAINGVGSTPAPAKATPPDAMEGGKK